MLDGRKLHLKEVSIHRESDISFDVQDTEGHIFPPLQSKRDFYRERGDDYRPYHQGGQGRGRGGRF